MRPSLLTGRDGRLALLAFTGTGPLAQWRADARAALAEGAVALLVDVAGPVQLAVEGPDLAALADLR